MITEYYTLGSRSEKEGLTLMTRSLHDDGSINIQYGLPEKWYKPNKITKEEYHSLKAEIRSHDPSELGLAGGLLDDVGLAELQALDNAQHALDEEDTLKQANSHVMFINSIVSSSSMTDDDVVNYVDSLNIRTVLKKKILEIYAEG